VIPDVGLKKMDWKTVDSQDELDELDAKVCWEDSDTVEYYAKIPNEPYFPSDVSRSGYEHKNVHVLCRVDSQAGQYLEMVFIHCDWFCSSFAEKVSMKGRVDTLKRVDIQDRKKSTLMRCARLIYRFFGAEHMPGGTYFRHSDNVS